MYRSVYVHTSKYTLLHWVCLDLEFVIPLESVATITKVDQLWSASVRGVHMCVGGINLPSGYNFVVALPSA
jgi:hypothetical protein